MDRQSLEEATRACRLVLLTATELEAAPLLEALADPHPHIVGTKLLTAGRIGSLQRAVVAIGGCDKANTAHVLTLLLEVLRPRPLLVLQVGIAGAFPPRQGEEGPGVGDLVLATEEIYGDTGASSPVGWLSAAELGLPLANVFPLDAALVRAAARVATGAAATSAPERGVQCPQPAQPFAGAAGAPAAAPRLFTGPCVTVSQVTGLREEGEVLARRWGALAESMEGAAAAQICALYEVPFLEIRAISNLVVDRDRASWEVDRAVAVAGRAALAIAAALEDLPLPAKEV